MTFYGNRRITSLLMAIDQINTPMLYGLEEKFKCPHVEHKSINLQIISNNHEFDKSVTG